MYSPVNVSKYLPTNIGLPINDMIKTAAITVIYMIIDMTAGKISSLFFFALYILYPM